MRTRLAVSITSCNLNQPQADGGELGNLEAGGFRQRLAHGPHQPVGSGMEDQPHLVGIGGPGTSTSRQIGG